MWVAIYGVLICPLCIFVPSVIQFLQGWFIITNYNFKQTFPPIIWIFTEGDEIKSMLSFKIFSTLRLFFSHLQSTYTEKISITEMTHALCWKFKKNICCERQFSNLQIRFPVEMTFNLRHLWLNCTLFGILSELFTWQ